MRPGGIARPNALARRRGLSFALDFSDPSATPWIRQTAASGAAAAVVGGFNAGAARDTLRAGFGLTNTGGYWGSNSASNTYSAPTGAGTIILAFVSDHDSGSAGDRIMLSVGNATFPTTPGVAFSNFFGNWLAGWADGADKRVSVPAAGLYASGEVLTAGLTWDASAQIAYMRGVQIGSGAAASYASTAGADFVVAEYGAALGTYPWIRSSVGGILYLLVFDRVLSAAEMRSAETDLWWWVEQPAHWAVARWAGGSLPALSAVSNLTLPALTVATAATAALAVTTSVSLSGSAASASTVSIAGRSVATFGAVAGTGTAAVALGAGASLTLAGITGSTAGAIAAAGQTAVTLAGIAGSAAGAIALAGSSSASVAGVAGVGTGSLSLAGASTSSLAVAGATRAALALVGASALTLGPIIGTMLAQAVYVATLPAGERSYTVTLPARAYAVALAARAYTVTLSPRSYT